MQTIQTEKGEISLIGTMLVKRTVKDEAYLEAEDILEFNRAKRSLLGTQRHVVLFVSGMYSDMSNEARELSAKDFISENCLAKAVIVTSLAHRLLGQFFIRFDKPPTPVRLFSTEGEGLEWLNTFVE